MSLIHDCRKSWFAAFQFPCSCIAPHFREWKAQRSHEQILIEHLLCFKYQGAKVNQVSAILAFNLCKECWDQKGVALSFSAGLFLNLDGMISWLPIILEPYLPYLYNRRSRIYPAFSLGLSSGPNESARGGKKKDLWRLCEQTRHSWCKNIQTVDKPHWPRIDMIMLVFLHAPANFTKGCWLHYLWLKEALCFHFH